MYRVIWETLKAVLRIRDVYPGSEFFHPGSEFFPSRDLGKYDPGCSSRIRILIFYSSRIQGSKRHRIPVPGSASLFKSPYKILTRFGVSLNDKPSEFLAPPSESGSRILMTKNWRNVFDQKLQLSLGFPKGRPSYTRTLKREHPAFQNMKILHFFLFLWIFPPGSGSSDWN